MDSGPITPGSYVLTMLKQAQLTDKEIEQLIHRIKSDLGQEFAELGLKNYKVIPYGSAVTGLFTNGSDVDLFIHCGHPVNKEKATAMIRKMSQSMKKRSRSKLPLYSDIVTMTNGRVPVLKCIHTPLGREININFTSHTGVNNSFLIKYLVSLDSRIRPMMVLLKMYFKMKFGRNGLTTFNLYSLIIFALQNCTDPVLPPLCMFLDSPSSNRDTTVLVENRWPVQFQLKQFDTKNRETVFELILHFCSFYANFDFANHLVSPYMGNRTPAVTKDNYATFVEFACSDHQFKFDRKINVQDFFVLCANLGSDFDKFQDVCKVHDANKEEYLALKDELAMGSAFFDRKI